MFLRKIMDFFRLQKNIPEPPVPEEKLDKVNVLKKKLLDEIEDTIPRDFIDSFTEELIQEPVMTDYGHVFERSSIEHWLESNHTCPLTREILTRDDLIAGPGIKRMLQQFKQQLEVMLKKINDMKSLKEETKIRTEVQDFKIFIQYHYMNWFNDEKDLLTQTIIDSVKRKKHLDIHNNTDLNYWCEQNKCCNIGLKTVVHGNSHFFLSEVTHHILITANKKYMRVSEFREALEKAKSIKVGHWARFWGDTPNTRQMLKIDFSNKHTARRFY